MKGLVRFTAEWKYKAGNQISELPGEEFVEGAFHLKDFFMLRRKSYCTKEGYSVVKLFENNMLNKKQTLWRQLVKSLFEHRKKQKFKMSFPLNISYGQFFIFFSTFFFDFVW